MATESPMRLVGSSGSRKWPSSKEAATLAASSNNVAAEELGLLLRGHRFQDHGRNAVPNRSGSAPPSMEGSFAAIGNLIGQQSSSLEAGWSSLNNAIENCESEEQLRADPAYVAYYYSNANLNPRLPPPLISRENRRLAQHIGGFGDNRTLTSFDDSSSESLFFSRAALSTHKEEPEEDRSPVGGSVRETTNDWPHGSTGFISRQFTGSSTGRHKCLVDLIQEDFPRTPSPVYNQTRSSTHAATEEAIDPDAHLNLLRDSSNTMSMNFRASTPTLGRTVGSVPHTDPSSSASAPVSSSSSTDKTLSPQPSLQGDSSTGDVQLDDDVLVGSVTNSGISNMEAALKRLNISALPKAEGHKRQQERHHPLQSNLQQYHSHPQRGTTSQGLHRSHSGSDHLPYGSKFSSSNLMPTMEVLQSSGITPHLYASTTAYMPSGNPFYPNLQPSSIFAPQYGLGGYALNGTLLPPLLYPSHGSIPMAFDNSAGPSFSARAAGVSAGASIPPGIDLQHLYKVYGLTTQPSFPDPLYMHYLQHPSEDGYNAAGSQYDPMVPGGGFLGGQTDAFYSQNPPSLAGYMADQKPQFLMSGAVNVPNPRKGGFASPSYYGSPPSMGLLMQYPSSPLASPVLPASPVAASVQGRKNENFRFSLGSNRNVGAYSGWQGQRGNERFDDPKSHSFLEELKSNKARRFELSDIAGRIVEFSADQHGSRFIQQKLETSSPEEKASVFEEVLPHASTLMTDVFGNYVIQKFFEHGSSEERKALADKLTGHILPLSLQMYGCRVIQKALEVVELDQKTRLVLELDGHVMRCVRDQNGNHVVQKCIECVPTDRIEFIISAFRGQVVTLSTHPYGCRVIQRVLEHCTNEKQSQGIVDEILQSACTLAQDQYGNYVTQHVLERGNPHERSQIINKLAGQIVHMSQHKFASNVIEKCLEYGDPAERELMIEEIVGQTEGNDNLLTMMKDQFANYVVQKILEICSDKQREILLDRIRGHLHALKKYTYGKHIVARVEQLSVEEIDKSEA